MNYNWLQNETDALIYIGDPLCSWCYGIAPELDQLKNHFPKLDFRIVMGGLRPFGKEKAIEMADFLTSHWVEIEKRTGQPFSYEILKNSDFIYDTEPPCRAIVTARNLAPALELEFFKAVQKTFYFENKDTNLSNTYLEIAKKFNFDLNKFEVLFHSDAIKEETRTDFQITQDMGIKGFPSLVLKKDGKYALVANGFDSAENITDRIENLR